MTTPLDPDDMVMLFVRPAERDALVAYRRQANLVAAGLVDPKDLASVLQNLYRAFTR